MGYQDLLYEVEESIATITLNRPKVMNALSENLERELHTAFDEADGDRDVRVIILTGEGPAFCAGYDQGPVEGGKKKTDPTGKSIADFIEGHTDGYDARVGERRIRLSGGQRQRIGIARALYKRASVLVLDEATSALDHATERLAINSIERYGDELTVIVVAHRLTTVERCDVIYQFDGGRLVAEGTLEELLSGNSHFRQMADLVDN